MDQSNTKPYHLPSDAVWFITGCSSGIGEALAQLVASEPGQRLVATARKLESLSTIPDSSNVLKLALDVTSTASVDAAVSAAMAKWNRVDVVVNNAGYSLRGDTEAATESQARQQMETIFWGTVRVTLHALRIMREENGKNGGAKGGLVMNVTSLGGFVGAPGIAFYHAGKFATEGFTESVAKEMHPDWNIHMCIIEPGGTVTKFLGPSTDSIAPHPAYSAPDMPARQLEAYLNSDSISDLWAPPEKMAGGMWEIARRGQRIPLRVPLGPDSWGMIRGKVERMVTELDELRELSFAAGNPKNLEEVAFLSKASES